MSEKKLQDYIPYYIGCRCLNTWFPEGHDQYDNNWILMGFHSGYPKPYCLENDEDTTWTDSIKPILRRLESISEDEAKFLLHFNDNHEIINSERILNYYTFSYRWKDEQFESGYGYSERALWFKQKNWHTDHFNYLLKQHFDLFGLIDSGLVIDSATLPKIN